MLACGKQYQDSDALAATKLPISPASIESSTYSQLIETNEFKT